MATVTPAPRVGKFAPGSAAPPAVGKRIAAKHGKAPRSKRVARAKVTAILGKAGLINQ